MNRATRARISSRMARTVSIGLPFGSSSGQSSRRRPGTRSCACAYVRVKGSGFMDWMRRRRLEPALAGDGRLLAGGRKVETLRDDQAHALDGDLRAQADARRGEAAPDVAVAIGGR